MAVFSQEDRLSLHRFKADEAYMIGEGKGPVEAYLDVTGIVALAAEKGVDAIHPGYGFLSENPALPRACERAGITFVGPSAELLELLGDKTAARQSGRKAGVPVIPGTANAVANSTRPRRSARRNRLPADHQGGVRRRRTRHARGGESRRTRRQCEEARQEAAAAFGNGAVFLERYIRRARHIEIQILGDNHGNILHLYERDCSVQRRNQKVVEVAPAVSLAPAIRSALADAAVALAREGRILKRRHRRISGGRRHRRLVFHRGESAHPGGTHRHRNGHGHRYRALPDPDRAGHPLHGPEINLPAQQKIPLYGFALQCRVTTEDPANNFVPDYGKIHTYRSPAGFGIRLDGASAYGGAVITPVSTIRCW